MQEAGVQLRQACWDVKQSSTGISVNLYWPKVSQTLLSSTLKISKSKKRRIRRNRIKCAIVDVKESKDLMPQHSKPVKPAKLLPIGKHAQHAGAMMYVKGNTRCYYCIPKRDIHTYIPTPHDETVLHD